MITTTTATPTVQYRAFLFTSSFGFTFIVAGLRLGALIFNQPFFIYFDHDRDFLNTCVSIVMLLSSTGNMIAPSLCQSSVEYFLFCAKKDTIIVIAVILKRSGLDVI